MSSEPSKRVGAAGLEGTSAQIIVTDTLGADCVPAASVYRSETSSGVPGARATSLASTQRMTPASPAAARVLTSLATPAYRILKTKMIRVDIEIQTKPD